MLETDPVVIIPIWYLFLKNEALHSARKQSCSHHILLKSQYLSSYYHQFRQFKFCIRLEKMKTKKDSQWLDRSATWNGEKNFEGFGITIVQKTMLKSERNFKIWAHITINIAIFNYAAFWNKMKATNVSQCLETAVEWNGLKNQLKGFSNNHDSKNRVE